MELSVRTIVSLVKDDDSYVAHDKNSTNGTRINGIRITEQRLCNGDILQVGGIEILLTLKIKPIQPQLLHRLK